MSLNPSTILRLVNGPVPGNETGREARTLTTEQQVALPRPIGHPRPRRRAHESSARTTAAQTSTDTQTSELPCTRTAVARSSAQ